jgi:3'(2'),5'-bisphosphate nucleotidase
VPPYDQELAVAQEAARQAGAVIMRHYAAGEIAFDSKQDGSPVSRADLEASAAIETVLRGAFPQDALLSEEALDSEARLGQRRVWIVDPLDGTRDFLARTGEFCVHVALAVDGQPAVGVVLQPVEGGRYDAVVGRGAFLSRSGTVTRLRVSRRAALGELRLGISRQNAPAALQRLLDEHGLGARAVPMGASTKYLALARGDLDALVTLTAGEKEWDTCAPELVLREAGGAISDGDGQPLRYNQRDLGRPRGIVASNGACHAQLVALVRPYLP